MTDQIKAEQANDSVGALILAAGTSSRMGEPKQLLRIGDNTLLGQVLANVRGVSLAQIVVVLGASADAIKHQVDLAGLKVVVNNSYHQGMGTSLAAGLAALEATVNAALIVLADQPFVQPETLKKICQEYRRTQAQIVIPLYKGFRGNPVLLDRSVFPEVMALRGDIGCRAIFGSHPEGIVKLPVEDAGILLDIDSKGDFEKLKIFRSAAAGRAALELADLKHREMPGDSQSRPELVIVGQEAVAMAMAGLGRLLNFIVTAVDPLLSVTDFPGADRILRDLNFSHLPKSAERYVVVASRGKFDEEAIEQALETESAYVALVANKKRGQEVIAGLREKGVSPQLLGRVHAPAGLDIGAHTPQEIALSIMAEIVRQHRKREVGSVS